MNKDIMKSLGYAKQVEEVGQGICPFCHKPVKHREFRDPNSFKEFEISGLCQSCQDKTFGGG